jgi:hypothetical protein
MSQISYTFGLRDFYVQQVLSYPCLVCGYGLAKPAADFTICPSCGVEFGYSDAGVSHRDLRLEWIEFGCPWTSTSVLPPIGWIAYAQLIAAGFGYDLPKYETLVAPVQPPNFSKVEIPVPSEEYVAA